MYDKGMNESFKATEEKSVEIETADSLLREEAIPDKAVLEKPTEQVESEKALKEKDRLDRIDAIRQELGMTPERRDEKTNNRKEDIEHLPYSLKQLSTDIEELSSTISRNKFPKVRFNSQQLAKVASRETIEEGAILRELQDFSLSISRIKRPEDRRDMMSLEPHNFRAVIHGIEDVIDDLSKLKGAFQKTGSGDYASLSQEVGKVRGRLDLKRGDLLDALSARERLRR